MPLTAADVEEAFVAAVREQVGGEAFDWKRVALHLNEKLAEKAYERRAAFLLRRDGER